MVALLEDNPTSDHTTRLCLDLIESALAPVVLIPSHIPSMLVPHDLITILSSLMLIVIVWTLLLDLYSGRMQYLQ
jgi:hypothetical protein